MSTKNTNKLLQKGSLMVEALALLGLITMVTPVMYKKAAERTTELQDINIATQMRTLNEALDNYVRNNYNELQNEIINGAYKTVDATDSSNNIVTGVNAYLPAGFNLSQSKYFDADKLKFSIKREVVTDLESNDHSVYTTAVLAPSLNPITFNRASKIASMIGINGGTIKDDKFEGAQGAWIADPSTWFGVTSTDLKTGSLMSISNEAIAESAAADTSKLLYRRDVGDQDKNTMKTHLLMDGNEIQDIKALFGDGGNLTIGSGDTDHLIVKGAANITSTLGVTGKATLKDELEVEKATTLKSTLDVTGKATLKDELEVEKATTLKSTLDVTGETTLANTSVDGTLDVTGATTLTDLVVTNDATIQGDLSVWGTLTSDNLHAKTKLTVGGENPDNPSVMKVDASTFDVNSLEASFNSEKFNVNIANSAGSQLSMTKNQTLLKNPTGNVFMELYYGTDPDVPANDKTYARLGSDAGQFISDAISNSISMETPDTKFIIGKYSGDPYASLKLDGIKRLTLDSSNTYIASGNANDTHTSLELNPDNFRVGVSKNDVSADIFLDNGGLAIGENLTGSGVNNVDPIDNPLTPASAQKVIISRNGYIEIAPPHDPDSTAAIDNTSGTKAGFIRARRLVSDVKYYYGDENFSDSSYDYKGDPASERYDYYQVNPAYTSIMNDIKLASRGGARLSDILSDYIIKGIYVGDNSYHAGYSESGGFNIENNWVSELNSDALIWDIIPIENGAVKNGVIQANDATGNTECIPEEGKECKIFSCQNADCVASPWMGFVPKPQCPPNYLAAITNSPIRWRMSEVYYLYDNDKDGINDLATYTDTETDQKKYNIIIKDLKSHKGDDAETERFSHYFRKHNDPKEAFFSIKTALPDNPHFHETSATPITFQTNTWLNSSVLPHYSGNEVDGWHILMGFLYKPNDYEKLLGDTGLGGADSEAIHWNIFPVYAHEMASIVTTYCVFAPTAGNGWNSNATDSPVLNYNQLGSETFRDPTGFDREPVAPRPENAGKGEGWAKQVNDPSLPYDDAW